jgi:hypothetical protein
LFSAVTAAPMALLMSGPPLTADVTDRSQVRSVGGHSDIVSPVATLTFRATSFDDFVSSGEHRGRNYKRECFCGFDVHSKREHGWSFERQIARIELLVRRGSKSGGSLP